MTEKALARSLRSRYMDKPLQENVAAGELLEKEALEEESTASLYVRHRLCAAPSIGLVWIHSVQAVPIVEEEVIQSF